MTHRVDTGAAVSGRLLTDFRPPAAHPQTAPTRALTGTRRETITMRKTRLGDSRMSGERDGPPRGAGRHAPRPIGSPPDPVPTGRLTKTPSAGRRPRASITGQKNGRSDRVGAGTTRCPPTESDGRRRADGPDGTRPDSEPRSAGRRSRADPSAVPALLTHRRPEIARALHRRRPGDFLAVWSNVQGDAYRSVSRDV